MKARVKRTGDIVEVDYIEGDYLHTSDGLYLIAELEGIESDIDYWTRLEHQYAGMAMQGLMSYVEQITPKKGRSFCDEIVDISFKVAHALVEKLKSSDL